MKRWITTIGLCWGLAATGSTRGEEVEWRAVGQSTKMPGAEIKQAQHDEPLPLPKQEPPKADAPKTDPPKADEPKVEVPKSEVPAAPNPIPGITGAAPVTSNTTTTVAPFVGPLPNDCVTQGPVIYSESYEANPTRFFVRGEFLAWWTKSAGGPPLLTTTSAPFPTPDANGNVPIAALNNIGALGAPGTSVLLDSDQFDDFRPGVRLSFGYWFDPCGVRGIDGSIFYTGSQSRNYTADSTQFSTLFRPFFAADPRIDIGNMPGQFREIIAATSLGINGSFAARSTSEFWGADLNYRRCLWRGCYVNADAFVGFRYLNLDEDLNIFEDIQATRNVNFIDAAGAPLGTLLAGSRFKVQDQFATSNDFYGAQLGVDAEFQRDRWYFGIRPSIALGVTHQQVCIAGSATSTVPGVGTENLVGGLLALNSNIGCNTSNPFTVVPELQLKAGYQLTNRLRIFVGADFLYWSSVVRPADQIDFTLDTNRLPPPQTPVVNPPRPAPLFNQTDFWAMGLNTGLEYRW